MPFRSAGSMRVPSNEPPGFFQSLAQLHGIDNGLIDGCFHRRIPRIDLLPGLVSVVKRRPARLLALGCMQKPPWVVSR